jgi:hypothetical protein
MQIAHERDALVREFSQVEIRLGDPHAPLLVRPGGADGGMLRTEACRLRPCRCRWKRLAAARLGLPDRRKMRSRRAMQEASSAQEKSRLRAPSSKRLCQFGF